MQRSRKWILALGAAAVTAALAVALGAALWLVLVLSCYGAGVAYGVDGMWGTLVRCRTDLLAWSNALVTERVADGAHRVTRAAQHAVDEAAELLGRYGETGAAEALRGEFARCRDRAAATLEQWKRSTDPDVARAADEGFLAGAAMTAPSRSEAPMRRFATVEGTPAWLPRAVRAQLVRLLRDVDVVRLLHTPDIERRSLMVSLWLRAAFVLVAPLAAGGSLTGLVPSSDETGALAGAVWVVISVFAIVTACLSGRIADYTIGQPTRMGLLVTEQALTTVAVITAPCWPIAIFGAGAVNWIERPDWRLRKLLIWMGLTYLPLAASALLRGATAGEAALEVVVGISVTAVMAGSYGLMFPATVTTFIGALAGSFLWRSRAYLGARSDRRDVELVIDQAERDVRRVAVGDPRAESVLAGLRQARAQLADPRRFLQRRSRVLELLCSQAITAIVPPASAETDATLKATRVVSEPPTVGALLIAKSAVARRLERLVKRVVLEALDNEANGAVYSRIGLLDDGRIELTIANDLPREGSGQSGYGTGGDWLARWKRGIPGCEVLERRKRSGEVVGVVGEVFSVRIAIGRDAFEQSENASYR